MWQLWFDMTERARVYFASVEPVGVGVCVCDDVTSTSLLITCYDTFIKWLIISVYHPLYIVYIIRSAHQAWAVHDMRNALSHTQLRKSSQETHLRECWERKKKVPQRPFQMKEKSNESATREINSVHELLTDEKAMGNWIWWYRIETDSVAIAVRDEKSKIIIN